MRRLRLNIRIFSHPRVCDGCGDWLGWLAFKGQHGRGLRYHWWCRPRGW